MDVQRKVAALIRRYKTDDPFRLAAYKNIRIVYADLGGKFGNYLKYKRSKFIIIDDKRASGFTEFCLCSRTWSCSLHSQ